MKEQEEGSTADKANQHSQPWWRAKRADFVLGCVMLAISIVVGLRVDAWVKQGEANSATRARVNTAFLELSHNTKQSRDLVASIAGSQQSASFVPMRLHAAMTLLNDTNLQNLVSANHVILMHSYVQEGQILNRILELRMEYLLGPGQPSLKTQGGVDRLLRASVETNARVFAARCITLDSILPTYFDKGELYDTPELKREREQLRAKLKQIEDSLIVKECASR